MTQPRAADVEHVVRPIEARDLDSRLCAGNQHAAGAAANFQDRSAGFPGGVDIEANVRALPVDHHVVVQLRHIRILIDHRFLLTPPRSPIRDPAMARVIRSRKIVARSTLRQSASNENFDAERCGRMSRIANLLARASLLAGVLPLLVACFGTGDSEARPAIVLGR